MKVSPTPIIVTLVAVACIGFALFYNNQKMQEQANAPQPESTASSAPNVTVVTAVPETYQAYISGHGEAKAHWSLTLKAQVSGEITSISESFASGNTVSKGHVIAQIDNTDYLQAVSNATAALAEAKLALQEEVDLGNQAKREWERSGVTQAPSSPLVFRTLQLEAAQATADDAKFALQTAQRDEKNTRISAPFDAVIVSREVSLGSFISTGDTVATLNSTDKVEIRVPLSLRQWQSLPQTATGTVRLQDVTTGSTWNGYVARFEQHLDDSSRQRSVVVALDQPFEQDTPLLPGTFLAVEIPGKSLENMLKLPSSAVSQDGLIWYVDAQDRLASIQATTVFQRDNDVYITPFSEQGTVRIVARPLVSYLNGMAVNPVVEEAVE